MESGEEIVDPRNPYTGEEIVDPRNPYTGESQISLEHKALHWAEASVPPSKRKEPEGGWDSHRTEYKQATW